MQLTLMRVNELGLKVRRAGLQHDLRAVQQKSHFCLDTLPGEEAEDETLEVFHQVEREVTVLSLLFCILQWQSSL